MIRTCSNQEHGGIPGLMGTEMKRFYFDDPYEYKCPNCKREYWIEDMDDNICPHCNVEMKNARRWNLYCPECEKLKKRMI
ncbi:MAG: hypothetical protein ACE5RP_00275 [Nitrosopumilus sp.]